MTWDNHFATLNTAHRQNFPLNWNPHQLNTTSEFSFLDLWVVSAGNWSSDLCTHDRNTLPLSYTTSPGFIETVSHAAHPGPQTWDPLRFHIGSTDSAIHTASGSVSFTHLPPFLSLALKWARFCACPDPIHSADFLCLYLGINETSSRTFSPIALRLPRTSFLN